MKWGSIGDLSDVSQVCIPPGAGLEEETKIKQTAEAQRVYTTRENSMPVIAEIFGLEDETTVNLTQ